MLNGQIRRTERQPKRRAAGIAISFAGVVFVIAKGTLSALYELSFSFGDLFIMGSVISWAVYSILLRRFAIPLGAFALLAVLSAIGLVLCIPFRAWELSHGKHIVWSAKTLAAILYVGILLAGLRQSLHTRLVAGRHLECR